MKKRFLCRFVLLVSLSFSFVFASVLQAKERRHDNRITKHVLMLGLTDNVKSNYFPKMIISEETGIMTDMIDKEFNTIIMENIMAAANASCMFVPLSVDTFIDEWASLIKVNNDGDECYSDISLVPSDDYHKVLDMAGAEYLLVLNQHYLKWQETPMRTLFHIVSYTLFDKDKDEIYRGNAYFTSMNLERPEKLRKISGKTSSRIAATVISKIK